MKKVCEIACFVFLLCQNIVAQNSHSQHPGNFQKEEPPADIRWISLNRVQPKNPEVENFQLRLANNQNIDSISLTEPSKLQQMPQRSHYQPLQMQSLHQSQQQPLQFQSQQEPVQAINNYNKEFIQKMANQLFLTQKYVPLLSDHQRFILNQDPLVRKYVFGNQDQSQQERTRSRQGKAKSLRNQAASKKNGGVDSIGSEGSRNFNADAAAQASNVKFLSLPLPSSYMLPNYKFASSFVPKYAFVRALQPYTTYNYNLDGSEGIQSHQPQVFPVQATPVTSQLNLETQKSHYHISSLKSLEDHYEHEGNNYQFDYDVKDVSKGNEFGHKETKENDKTYGHYYLKLPDGRFETVKYWADTGGFHANVEFKGRAVHPEAHSQNSYHHPHY